MYEKLDQCPVCKSQQFDNYMICDDHAVTGESFALVKCRTCSLVFTSPRPKEEFISKYYQSDDYISHTDKGNSLINTIYKIVRSYTLKKKVRLINNINKKPGSLLDYGCGTGDFIKVAKQNKWHALGYEPDEKAKNIAQSKNPNAIIDTLKDIPEKLDLITAWHVIEHVQDLKPTLKTLKKKLRRGGHLILALPNYKSYDAEYYREYWAGYDVPRHLYHFDQDSMKFLAKKLKLRLVKTLPMKFDSFYVSMLSEKHKNGNLLNSFKIGLNSNLKANKTNQYSSLIYILKK